MVGLGGRKTIREAVDRRGRCGNDLLDVHLLCGLHDVVSAGAHDLERLAGLGRARRDSDRGHVHDGIDLRGEPLDELLIPDVALDEPDPTVLQRRVEIGVRAPRQIVEHDDRARLVVPE